MTAILTIDQGTTSSKALVVDIETGTVRARGAAPVGISFPQQGWVEQDADDIWESVQAAVATCLAATDMPISGLSISNQRESVVAWRRSTGRPVGPVLGWQDSRTAVHCGELGGWARQVRERTGLPLDPMYSAPKIRWLVEHAVAAGAPLHDLQVGTVDSWLLHKLTGEHVTEAGNASRTLLLDIDQITWDAELAEAFGVPMSVLPEVRPSGGSWGRLRDGVLGLGAIPVAAVLADSHAALFHHAHGASRTAKATYGTGSSVMVSTSGRPPGAAGASATVAWQHGRVQYAAEGNILTSGAGLDWVARLLGAPAGVTGGGFLSELAAAETDSCGVSFVPAFTGLGAPHWDRDAVGILTGVTGATSRGHVALAALEAVAHQVCDVVEVIASETDLPDCLVADGGASASPLLMQLQADLLGRPVEVAARAEASALGAADLAAVVLGAPAPEVSHRTRHEPQITGDERAARRAAWAAAVRRSRGVADPPDLPAPSTTDHLTTTGAEHS